MTTFVVSLFLPHTIDFKGHQVREENGQIKPQAPLTSTASSPAEQRPGLGRRTTTKERLSSRASLLELSSPETPAAGHHDELNPFARLSRAGSTSSLSLSRESARKMARTDSVVPEWGYGLLNQPSSLAEKAPPATILKYGKAHVESADAAPKRVKRSYSRRRKSKHREQQDHGSLRGLEWTVEPAVQGNGGLTNAIRGAADSDLLPDKHFVGTLGFPTDCLADETKSAIDEKLQHEHESLAVFVSDTDFDGHYRHFCKTILWPDNPKSKAYEDHSWKHYVSVNEAFAKVLVENYKQGDEIWVHDYHLLLLPLLIRKELPRAKIGLYLHSPFPSWEIFRCLAMRKQLLDGMLGADLVVFQADEYAIHFLQTCAHLLVTEPLEDGVQLDDRFVHIASIPLGVVPAQIRSAIDDDPEVRKLEAVLGEKYKGKRVIVAIDKLEATRGIRNKLLAFEMFLDKNPELAEQVVLVQVVLSTETDLCNLDMAIAEVSMRIDHRHSTLAHQPLVILQQDIDFAQHLALLAAADVLMITSLRDGMNLTCHEFLVCQDGANGNAKKNGALILSEVGNQLSALTQFTGAATVFGNENFIPVNPWNFQQCAHAIQFALEMPEAERERRFRTLLQVVVDNDAVRWVQDMQARLKDAYEHGQQRQSVSVPRLSLPKLADQYSNSMSRLFLIDYEGTLISTMPSAATFAHPQRVTDILVDLIAASDGNIVYVMSSLPPDELEQLFKRLPGLGLIAEDGCFIRPFTTEFTAEAWIDLVAAERASKWKASVLSVLQYYTERIEGSVIEERASQIMLRYDDVPHADTEAAGKLAADCANHLNDSCRDMGVRVTPVEKGVLVKLKGLSKRAACAKVLQHEQLRLAHKLDDEDLSLWTRSDDTDTSEVSSRGRSATVSSTNSRSVSHLHGSQSPALPAIREISVEKVVRQDRLSFATRLRTNSVRTNASSPPFASFSSDSDDLQSALMSPLQSPTSPMTSPQSVLVGIPVGIQLLFVAGDDRDDEPVFQWANTLSERRLVRSVVTVTLGRRATTEARNTLTQGVPGLLNALARLSKL